MTKELLKKKLLSRIKSTEDEMLLEEVYRLLEQEDLGVYQLSEEQIEAVKEGQEEIRKGEFVEDKDADNEIDEWLKE